MTGDGRTDIHVITRHGTREWSVDMASYRPADIDMFITMMTWPANEDQISPMFPYFLRGLLVPPDAYFCETFKARIAEAMDRLREEHRNEPIYFSEACAHALTRYEEWWRDEASPQDRTNTAAVTMFYTQRQMRWVLNTMTDLLIGIHRARNEIGVPFVAYRALPDRLQQLPLNDIEDLLDPTHYDTLLAGWRWSFWLRMLERQYVRILLGVGVTTSRSLSLRLEAEAKEADFPGQKEALEGMLAMAGTDINPFLVPAGRFDRREMKAGRKALQRGKHTYERIFGARGRQEIRTFLRGDPVVLTGTLFDYKIQKSYSAVEHSIAPDRAHVPFHLDLINKEGDRLAAGCIYFKDTPVVDQLMAMALHARTEADERAMLANINLSDVSIVGAEDVLLRSIKGRIADKVYRTRAKIRPRDMLHLNKDEVEGMKSIKARMLEIAFDRLAAHTVIPRDTLRYLTLPSRRRMPRQIEDVLKTYDEVTNRGLPFLHPLRPDTHAALIHAVD